MNTTPFVYLAISLTHVPEAERPDIEKLVNVLKTKTRFLQWAFDPSTWKPREVDNVYNFDTSMVGYADFMSVVFLSSAGSDGRGGESVLRTIEMRAKGMCFYIQKDLHVSRFVTDMAKHHGILMKKFETIEQLAEMIVQDASDSLDGQLWRYFPGEKNRKADLDRFYSGDFEGIASREAFSDMRDLLRKSDVPDNVLKQQELAFL